MASIKGVLVKASSFSDGGVTKGMPPTYPDVQMRIKHTSDSVDYNLDHASDHFAELVAQLGKLYGVDRGKAELLAEKVCKIVDGWYRDVQPYKPLSDDKRD